MKKNNKGFSLVELVVIIAIIGVLVTTVSFSVNYIFRASAQQASSDFSSLVTQCKVATLSGEDNPTVTIEYDASSGKYFGRLFYDGNIVITEELSERHMSITYSLDSGANWTDVTSPLEISFQENGALADTIATVDVTGEHVQIMFSSGGLTDILDITASTGYIEVN